MSGQVILWPSDRGDRDGEYRIFNLFESMYPLNIRKEAENGLFSAFQFWKLPKTKMRFDELLTTFYLSIKISL